jgi:predicted RNase H-like HicB family nuclease
MDLKRVMSRFTFRIEPKPEGGFIAHVSDPGVAPLEAPTREELQRKIQENIAAGLAAEFSSLKLPLDIQGLKYSFHIESKPGGGFAIHCADPNAQPIEGAIHEEIESHFAEKLIGFVGKRLMPELAQAIAAKGVSGEVQVFVKGRTGFAGAQTFSLGAAPAPSSSVTTNTGDARSGDTKTTDANLGSAVGTIGNSPITPETSSSWIVYLFLLVFLLGALGYFFLHYR